MERHFLATQYHIYSSTRLFFTCKGQHKRDEEKDEARTGATGHASRFHLSSGSGAQGDACKRRFASSDSSLLANVHSSYSRFLNILDTDALTLLLRRIDRHEESHPRLSIPTRGCCRDAHFYYYLFLRLPNYFDRTNKK